MATAASRLSSGWAKAALAALVIALAAAAAGLALARDGDDDEAERREAVKEYIAQLNIAQQAALVELERAGDAYRGLRVRAKADPKQLRRLTSAETTLRRLRTKLASVPAPPDVRTLRRRMLVLLDRQVGLAAEVRGLAIYVPLRAREAKRMAAASAALSRGLGAATTAAEQQVELAAYRKSLAAIADRLDRAHAPAVLETSQTQEVRRLRRLAREAGQVSAALEGRDPEQVERRFLAFLRTNASVGTTRAERDAVVAYNSRVEDVTAARTAVAKERERLEFSLR